MKAKQKKQFISLVVLVVLLGALIGGYFIISKMNFDATDEETDTADTTITVVSADAEQISSLTYAKKGEEALTFVREGGVWYYEADKDFPVKQSLLTSMASVVSSVTAVRELTGGDTGEYGFDESPLSVSTVYADGTEYTLTLGKTNTFNSNVYLKDQAEKIYMFEDSLSATFAYSLNADLIELDDPTAEIGNDDIVDFTVTAADGTQNVIDADEGILGASETMDKLDCSDWVEYAVDSEKFAEYGISDASAKFTVNYKVSTTVKDASGTETSTMVPKSCDFIFGSQFAGENDEGESTEYVYYTVTGSTILYKTELATYAEAMAWIEYTAPETTEAESEAETEASDTTDE